MGFFKTKDGERDYYIGEWKDLGTGWGKTKYIGREIKTLIFFAIGVYIFFYLISNGSI